MKHDTMRTVHSAGTAVPKRALAAPVMALAAAFFLVTPAPLRADDSGGLTITQIDSSRLVSTQTVRAYLDVREDGYVPDIKTITVEESPDGSSFEGVRVRDVSRNVNRDEGISFFLLLDNSGSMWDDLDGKPTTDPGATRMSHAKKAIRDFIASLAPQDRVALATFNTGYDSVLGMSSDAGAVGPALDGVDRPEREMGYTELYGAVDATLSGFGETGRRKALVILSDGEHLPPASAKSRTKIEDGIESAVREGVTCYAVNFGDSPDNKLPRLARESGGLVFDADNSEEILDIYTSIRSSILDEYAVDYTAAMFPGDKRYVRVTYRGENSESSSVRRYYSGTVLGSGAEKPAAWHALFVLVPLLLWLLLLCFKLERETTQAGIQLLYGAQGAQTRAFPLSSGQTIIGGDDTADITIAGNPSMRGNAATIVFDDARGRYTIAAQSDLTVNNKPVKTKILEPGDVINMSGTVVVFDDKDAKKS